MRASVSVGPAKSGTAGGVGRGDDAAVKADTAARPPARAAHIAASPYLAMASLLLLL
jgi:hypothetical protein